MTYCTSFNPVLEAIFFQYSRFFQVIQLRDSRTVREDNHMLAES